MGNVPTGKKYLLNSEVTQENKMTKATWTTILCHPGKKKKTCRKQYTYKIGKLFVVWKLFHVKKMLGESNSVWQTNKKSLFLLTSCLFVQRRKRAKSLFLEHQYLKVAADRYFHCVSLWKFTTASLFYM